MAWNDLFVTLDSASDPAGLYALWLADTLGLGLTAAVPSVEPHLPTYLGAELPSDLLVKAREEAEDMARIALSRFAEMAKERGVALDTRIVKCLAGETGRDIMRLARYFDLTILGQGNPDQERSSEIVESTLFGSGRPILIVPYIFKEPGRLKTAVVGWDGGNTAARALADALPLLARAQNVQIVTVADRADETVRRSHLELIRHLARHGMEAEARTLFSVGDPANTLLSHAADSSADLLVMGGYGHSRMRELILGGVTRDILRSMTVPVLMSH
jgi:nucleotide-binding universal stress UspA family protein